jgi:hypothetical protein
MPRLKYYNPSTEQWEYVAVGAQGPSGIIVSDTAPESTNGLWLDSDEEAEVPVPIGGTTGQVLAKSSSIDYDTAWTTQEGYRFVQTLYYTSSGTFTKATYHWLRAIKVKTVGGGGGGCGSQPALSTQLSTGNGGSGASYAESFITDIEGLSSSMTITIGAGGAGGAPGPNDGSAGGTSSFGTLVSAPGGLGGNYYLFDTFPQFQSTVDGGSGAVGDITQNGGHSLAFSNGHTGLRGALHGGGGSSFFGDGPGQAQTSGPSGGAGRNGLSAVNYGAGGSASHARGGATSGATGGAGANGIVIVELYA